MQTKGLVKVINKNKKHKRTRGEIVEDLFRQLESKIKRQEEQVKWDRLMLETIKMEYKEAKK